jgi:ribose 5-phosphate isomerase B
VIVPIAIGSDDAGHSLKEVLVAHVRSLGYTVSDYSDPAPAAAASSADAATMTSGNVPFATDDYPDVAERVALAVAAGQHPRAILVCGTGIGMAIAANKVPGVRAAQAHDTYSAERARKSNDAQIVTLGARVVGPELAKSIVTVWLESEFEGELSPSIGKVRKLIEMDDRYRDALTRR